MTDNNSRDININQENDIKIKVQKKRELVELFLNQITETERDNYHFISNIFSPDDHFLHIQETYGFNKWLESQKQL